jgi:hypothetical protein
LKPNFVIWHEISSISSHDVMIDATKFPRTVGISGVRDVSGGNAPRKVMSRDILQNYA